jgi:alanine racemase
MQINQSTIDTRGGIRPTFVEVNLKRLTQNLEAIRRQVSPARVMIILKANAYGHGLVEVARHLGPGADYIGVAVICSTTWP